jgi:hypothetical protein
MTKLLQKIKDFTINVSDYDTITKIEREIEDGDAYIVLELTIIPDELRDTSELDYFNGTGYSTEIIKNGHIIIDSITISGSSSIHEVLKLENEIIKQLNN